MGIPAARTCCTCGHGHTHEVKAHEVRSCRGQAPGASGELGQVAILHGWPFPFLCLPAFSCLSLPPCLSVSVSLSLSVSFPMCRSLTVSRSPSLSPIPWSLSSRVGHWALVPASLSPHTLLHCRGHPGQVPKSNLHLVLWSLRARA